MPFSDVEGNKIIDAFTKRTASYTAPTAVFVGLSWTIPTKAGGNINETANGTFGYARVQIQGTGDWNAATLQESPTSVDKTFPAASGGNWLSGNNATAICFFDAQGGAGTGNFLGFASLSTPRAVLDGDTAKILAGQLVVKIT